MATILPENNIPLPDSVSSEEHQQETNSILSSIINSREEISESDQDDSQLQWQESMNQLTGLINFIIIPLVGRMLGRRFANISK